jgi:hypothetical protein
MLIGVLIVAFMLLTSGKREDRQATYGFAVFHAKALAVVVGLILFVNWLR